jgi:hypothetical protein
MGAVTCCVLQLYRGSSAVAFSHNGIYLAVACSSHQSWSNVSVKVYSVVNGSRMQKLSGHSDMIHDIAWSTDDT